MNQSCCPLTSNVDILLIEYFWNNAIQTLNWIWLAFFCMYHCFSLFFLRTLTEQDLIRLYQLDFQSYAICIWKFVQCHFKASKLNLGCCGYLDKIYKILVDILDLKAGFPLANFFIRSDFFRSKTIKSRIGSYFFYFEKSH